VSITIRFTFSISGGLVIKNNVDLDTKPLPHSQSPSLIQQWLFN